MQILQEVKELVQKITVPQTDHRPFEFGNNQADTSFHVGDDWDVDDDDNNMMVTGGEDNETGEGRGVARRQHRNDWLMVSIGGNGKLSLLPKNYVFPKMLFPNFVVMWFCGDRSKNVAHYDC